ncbi:uncharacterized protein EHS24_008039 [Apiotrichum porosum]|uniref:Major facilitator superfamily (MFS) profile domain-containing protein n=1 Tax=Apiotrichum porosum TaxID=105984 RepID=A0A427XSN1_9TREE|nr:uncharacterized protein EHS24_008039 [Apiotrichum porosum]RSH81844.1 hypothetical protein EHS24_008039 [Apiotrichum porosum]
MEKDSKPVGEHIEHQDDKGSDPHHYTSTGAEVCESAYAGYSRAQVLRVFWKSTLFCALAVWAGLSDGYEYVVTVSIVSNQGFINQFGTVDASGTAAIPAVYMSLWGGLLASTQLIGQLVAGWLSDATGRKGTMYTFTVFCIVGVSLECAATEWKLWLAAKTLMGVALGMVQVSITTYVSEVAPAQIRGALLSGYSLAFALGQFASAIALQIIQTSAQPLKWRRAVYSQWVFIGIWMIIMVILPESPWYWAGKQNVAQAKASLRRLYGNIPGYDVDREYAVMEKEIAHSKAIHAEGKLPRFAEIFKGVNLRRTLASMMPIMLQQLCGVPIFFSYLTYLFQMAGIKDPFQSTVIMYVILLVGITISFWTTELVGRRPVLLWGCVLMVLANIGLGITGSVKTTDGALRGSLAMSCIWVFVYSMSAAPLGWISAAETATPYLKSLTTGFAIGCYSALNLIFQFCVPLMLAKDGADWGVKAAYLFAGLAILGGIGIYFLTPETAGRTYSELDELFESGISPRKFAQTKTSAQMTGTKDSERVSSVV